MYRRKGLGDNGDVTRTVNRYAWATCDHATVRLRCACRQRPWSTTAMSRAEAADSRVVRALVFSALALWLVGTVFSRGWIVGPLQR